MKRYTFVLLFMLLLQAALQASATTRRPLRIAQRGILIQQVSVQKADGQLAISMQWLIDSLRLSAQQRIVLTPMLVGKHDSITLQPVVINSKRQQIMYNRRDYKRYPHATVMEREKGGSQHLTYNMTTTYQPWMRNADFTVREDLCGCGNTEDQQATVIKRFRQPQVAYIQPQAAAQKTYELKGRAYIDFPVNRTELHPGYRQNPRELAKIVDTINIVKADRYMTITNIDIHGYASPESPYTHNAYLAEHRAATLKNYVRQLVKLDDKLFTVHYTPEDWDGLCRYIAGSNLDHKEQLLALASNDSIVPDEREARIKAAYPQAYAYMLATWYPALRHSDYIISCVVRPVSTDEAKQLIKTKPQLLSQNEMYRVAQTCQPGSKEFNEVFEIAVRLYPDDPTANLNAACTRLQEERYDEAKPYLDKAGNSPEANNARGIYCLATDNEAQAISYFKSAAQAGCQEAQANLDSLR